MASRPVSLPSFTDGLRVQLRVIGALLRREMLTRFGRHNIGFLWLFVEPMIFTIGVTILWTATKSVHGSDLPIVAFALTGYSSVLLWRNMPGRCIGALQANLALMYHRNIKVFDIYAARLLLEFGGATISFAVLAVLYVIRVQDDGEVIGSTPTRSSGFGLVGMSERASLLGGTLDAGPGPGRGWLVDANLPRSEGSNP